MGARAPDAESLSLGGVDLKSQSLFELTVFLDSDPQSGLTAEELALLCRGIRESEQVGATIASLLFRDPSLLMNPQDRAAVIDSFCMAIDRSPHALLRLLAQWTEATLKNQDFSTHPELSEAANRFLEKLPRVCKYKGSIAYRALDWHREIPEVPNPHFKLGIEKPTRLFIAALEEIALQSFKRTQSEERWRTIYDLCAAAVVGKSCAALLNPIIAFGGQAAAVPFFWATLSGIFFFALSENHMRASHLKKSGSVLVSPAQSEAISTLVEIYKSATAPKVNAFQSRIIRFYSQRALAKIARGLGTTKRMLEAQST